jgi:hypothetical protein
LHWASPLRLLELTMRRARRDMDDQMWTMKPDGKVAGRSEAGNNAGARLFVHRR